MSPLSSFGEVKVVKAGEEPLLHLRVLGVVYLFLVKKGGTAKLTPFVLLLDEGSFYIFQEFFSTTI
ncbi:hypothetical protein BC6307_16400 [Sutcliffiella cohnii]|uniref:Uncharacterized protein n=1 Tax=Sutcliffiella cohnii TaxID=33932 RepID=A0A223KTV5_9BACI|nr:hypothetical protein BC6307_16400 [Sutcliffiella cohnii]